MSRVFVDEPIVLAQAKETRPSLLFVKCGVWFSPYHDSSFWSKMSWAPIAGLMALFLHPTVASVLGPRPSKAFAVLAMVLLLPACRKIVIAPFVAILIACVLIGLHNKSVSAIMIVVPTYAIFHLLAYETPRFYRAILVMALIAGTMALLQFLFPSELLNFHATAESMNRFLDQYRPTSIFPTQAYYNQFLLLMIPLFFLVGEKRIWLLVLVGFSAAITGSTAGLVVVALSLLLGLHRIGSSVVAGFAAAIAMMAAFYPDRLMYNFSLTDQYVSIASRVRGAPIELTETMTSMLAAIAAGHPTLAIAVQDAAICGALLAAMMAIRMAIPLSYLLPLCAAVSAIVAGQLIHPTMGSLYSSLTLAVLSAIIWNFVTLFTKRTSVRLRH